MCITLPSEHRSSQYKSSPSHLAYQFPCRAGPVALLPPPPEQPCSPGGITSRATLFTCWYHLSGDPVHLLVSPLGRPCPPAGITSRATLFTPWYHLSGDAVHLVVSPLGRPCSPRRITSGTTLFTCWYHLPGDIPVRFIGPRGVPAPDRVLRLRLLGASLPHSAHKDRHRTESTLPTRTGAERREHL